MTQRNYYLRPDGEFEQAHTRADRVRLANVLSPAEVRNFAADAWSELREPLVCSPVKAWVEFALAVARHETGLAENEVDVEDDTTPRGFTSRGLCQISDGRHFDGGHYFPAEDEVREALGGESVDLMDPTENLRVTLAKSCAHGRAILRAERRSTISAPPPDFFSFLALAHNEGLGEFDPHSRGALATLARHPERGLSWSAYKLGNGACGVHGHFPDLWGSPCATSGSCSDYIRRIGHYGDDCAAGARS